MHVFSTLLKKLNVIHILIYMMISAVFLPVEDTRAYIRTISFSCKNFKLIKAAGKPGSGKNFNISFSSQCELIRVKWVGHEKIESKHLNEYVFVSFNGYYNYKTKQAKEIISYKGLKLYSAWTWCSSNPWAHIPSCDKRGYSDKNIIGTLDPNVVPTSAYDLPGTTRNTLSKWETSLSTKDLLAGWRPLPEKGAPDLVILNPSGFTPTNGDSFKLDLVPVQTPLKGSVIEIEWALIGKSKDPSLSKEEWYMNTPSQAPKTLNWHELPAQIKIKDGNNVIFSPGKYALRVKFQGLSESTWTDWKRFRTSQLRIKRFKY